jgi:hypothetical protein
MNEREKSMTPETIYHGDKVLISKDSGDVDSGKTAVVITWKEFSFEIPGKKIDQ